MCLGINPAYSKLYVLLGGTVRRYDLYDGTDTQTSPTLALYDTTYDKDIKVRYDCLVPFLTKGSKGVQVKAPAWCPSVSKDNSCSPLVFHGDEDHSPLAHRYQANGVENRASHLL